MKDIVKDAIHFYYEQSNERAYLERCRSESDTPQIILATATLHGAGLDFSSAPGGPAYRIQVSFGICARGLFVAEFTTSIVVSKLAPLFNILHSFSVENRHERPSEPTLDGYAGTGFIVPQMDLHTALCEQLTERGYTELELADMDEVVPTLSPPRDASVFGRQVTVQFALFYDLLGLCSADCE